MQGCSTHVPSSNSDSQADSAPTSTPAGEAHLPNGTGGIKKTGNPYRIAGQWYTPMKTEGRYDKAGVASWYGKKFHGLRTANGEIYDMHSLSAAHKILPLPTIMRVTNLENGRSVIVRVNDRGPFVKDRLIDLSYAAATVLGFTKQGTAHVRVQSLEITPSPTQETLIIGTTLKAADKANTITISNPALLTVRPAPPTAAPAGNIFVQLGAFGSKDNATRLQITLKANFSTAHVVTIKIAEKTLYRVRIGPFADMARIEQTVLSLRQQGFKQPMVIIE